MTFAFLMVLAIAQDALGPRPTPLQPENWITAGDYPAPALRASEEGRVGYRLDVDAVGTVTGCSVVASSGSGVLDVHTCDLLRLRARFEPAHGPMNNAVPSQYSSGIDWTLPDGGAVDVTAFAAVDRNTIEFLVGSDGRITQCTVVELVGAWQDPHAVSPCAQYAIGSRYSDPTTRDGRPVSGRIRRTVSETRNYSQH